MNVDRPGPLVAITGATGFLGSHITERLLAEGWQVRILARDPARATSFADRVEKIVYADICDKDALNDLFAGVDMVVHLVSNFRVVGGAPESYHHVNHQGTIAALEAAGGCGVSRFIHCSTIGVHGDVAVSPASEDSPFNPGDLYQKTKLLAEDACRSEMKLGRMEVTIARPTSQYGPGDTRMLKMFRMISKQRFVLIGPCKENFHAVYIDDLVEGFWLILNNSDIAGETYLLGGDKYVSLQEYINTASSVLGVPGPRLRLPYWPVYGLSWLCEMLCKPLGLEPPLHRRRVRFFRNNRAFDINKAQVQLGYQPVVELEDGMRRTVSWYREQGLLE